MMDEFERSLEAVRNLEPVTVEELDAFQTDTRSVAEIMGWPVVDGQWIATKWYPGPSVDDMLTWLRERVFDWSIHGRESDTTVYIMRTGREMTDTPFTAPTLHAALEAAVRAVAAESSAPTPPPE